MCRIMLEVSNFGAQYVANDLAPSALQPGARIVFISTMAILVVPIHYRTRNHAGDHVGRRHVPALHFGVIAHPVVTVSGRS